MQHRVSIGHFRSPRIALIGAWMFATLGVSQSVLAQDADSESKAAPAEAQAETTKLSEAEQLRADGHKALAAGRVAEACGLLEKSNDSSPNEDVLFEAAQCQLRAKNASRATRLFERVEQMGGARATEARVQLAAMKEEPKKEAPAEPAETSTEKPAADGPKPMPKAVPKDKPKKEAPSPYAFSDFMDTRLTWTFGDDDILHSTGETTPLSPNASIGDRRQYRLFFDGLNSLFGGRENLTHLVLYKKMPGFIKRLDTEASVVLRFDIGALSTNTNNVNSALYDSGSFIRLFYRTGDANDSKTGLGLTFYVLDTDRMRLGYLYDISWGGTNARINQSIFPRIQGSAPGAKLQFDHKDFNLYFGLKTAQIVQVAEILSGDNDEAPDVVRVAQTNFGFLGGGSFRAGKNFSFDAGGGYFQQGKFDLADVLGEPVFTFGFSGRAAVHSENTSVANSIDFSLYRNDPMKHQRFFRPVTYTPNEAKWSATMEYTNLFQNLKDFDVPGQTQLQQARAAAIQGNLQTGYSRVSLTGIYRDLPFVLRNVPSFVPFETLPSDEDAETGDELFVAAAFDYHFRGPRLTPGLGAGLQFPATFKTSSIDQSGETISRTVVVRQQGNVAILPVNRNAVPIFQARASLKWDISEILSSLVWVQYVRDNNGTFVEQDPNNGTVALRTFVSPNFFGFGTSVSARF